MFFVIEIVGGFSWDKNRPLASSIVAEFLERIFQSIFNSLGYQAIGLLFCEYFGFSIFYLISKLWFWQTRELLEILPKIEAKIDTRIHSNVWVKIFQSNHSAKDFPSEEERKKDLYSAIFYSALEREKGDFEFARNWVVKGANPCLLQDDQQIGLQKLPFDVAQEFFYLSRFDLVQLLVGHGAFHVLPKDIRYFFHFFFVNLIQIGVGIEDFLYVSTWIWCLSCFSSPNGKIDSFPRPPRYLLGCVKCFNRFWSWSLSEWRLGPNKGKNNIFFFLWVMKIDCGDGSLVIFIYHIS